MMTRPFATLARGAAAALLATAALAAQASGKGHLGISLAVDGEGTVWNPTLKSVKVAKVLPGSPAARAGLAEGDLIVEIEGRQVAGARAYDLQPYMQRDVGQTVRFVVRKPSGELRPVVVTAGPKPE